MQLCISANQFAWELIKRTFCWLVIRTPPSPSYLIWRITWRVERRDPFARVDRRWHSCDAPPCGLLIQTQTCTDNPSLCRFAPIAIRFISLFQIPAVRFTSPTSSLVARVLWRRRGERVALPYRHSQPTSRVVVQRFASFLLFTFIRLSCATLLHTTDQVIYELDLKEESLFTHEPGHISILASGL